MSSKISSNMDAAIKAAEEKMNEDAFAPIIDDATTKETSEPEVIITDDIDEEDLEEMKESIEAPEVPTEIPFKSKKVTDNQNESLSINDVMVVIPDLEGSDKEEMAQKLFDEIEEYRKNAMIKYGMTPEEADHAAAARLVKRGDEINTQYVKDHPTGVITVKKEDAQTLVDLNFTEEEKDKLKYSKAIRLVAIEDQKLRMIKSKKIPSHINKANYIRSIDAAISSYHVPLPVMGDYVQVTGAQTLQMATAFGSEDDNILDITVKQAQLVYDRFYSSMTLKKYDDQNRIILTYDDFINAVPYNELNMLLYAVYVASTPEEQDLQMACGKCKKDFVFKMNAKKLIPINELPDKIRTRIDDILKHTQNSEYLTKMGDFWKTETTMESPKTGNIYSFQHPTIAKVIDILSRVDLDEEQEVIRAVYMIYLNSMYIKMDAPDEEGNEYVQVTYPDDIEAMLQLMKDIPETDIMLLMKQINEISYNLPIKIFPVCPHCGNKMTNSLELERLVFRKAQDMSAEIL